MGRSRYAKVSYILLAILVLMAAYFIFSSLTANADTPSSIQVRQVVDVPSLYGEGELLSITAAPVFPQATQDGQVLMNKRCTPCHMNASFEQLDKTLAEWEETLLLMEAMGLQLSQDEKELLLEYLSEP